MTLGSPDLGGLRGDEELAQHLHQAPGLGLVLLQEQSWGSCGGCWSWCQPQALEG